MSTFITSAKLYYQKEYDNSTLIQQLGNAFDPSIASIDPKFTALLHRLLNETPSKYWNKKTAHQVFDKLESCILSASTAFKIEEDTFAYFLMGYQPNHPITITSITVK